jgi:hypothetical protein
MCNQTYYNIAPSQEVAEWLMGLANGTEAHSRSEYKRLTTLKGEPNLLAENARLKAERDSARSNGAYLESVNALLRAALKEIARGPESNAMRCARAALAEE